MTNGFDAVVAEMRALHEERARCLGITPDELDARIRREQEERERSEARAAWIKRHREDVAEHVLAQVWDGPIRDEAPTMAARKWWDSDVPMLILCGATGAGKTFAAVCLVREHGGEIVRAIDLARRIDPWESELRHGVREIHLGARLSVLDDLGSEMDTARVREALYRYVDGRLRHGCRTVITANIPKADIRRVYGDRIADRLNPVAVAVEFTGPSLRPNRAGL